ncbi:MAG: hypothetical protein CMB80_09205 [Flammeovirgaceae bacterium]|nr:hypothetical protein [Flammeovirgaceae bacterium]MBE61188.1 hypothetical protein [Flammeovirgaceae bacterium]HCX22234.1 hypothetical protein [Cytophagales bacterium]|tara:strand:+ start:1357 stop:2187 length:831 start_codon:yes stop_codon:yes gene_type:complete
MSQKNRCLSCGNEFDGSYCNHCGEKVIDQKDRRLIHFLGELFNALTFADSKVWRSVKSIILYPGRLSHDFIAGKRKPYMKPVALFFLANFIYFLFPIFNTFNTNLYIQTHQLGFHSELANRWVQEEVQERQVSYTEYQTLYDAKTTELSKLLLIAMVFMMALLFWPIHLGSENSYLFDQVVFSFEFMAFTILFTVELIGVLMLITTPFDIEFMKSDMNTSIIMIVLISYFLFRSEQICFGFNRWRSILNTLLGVGVVGLVLTCYRIMLFFVTFWLV